MNRRFRLAAAAILALPGLLSAQAALAGIVHEDTSKSGLAGVEVVIQALDRKATTDSAGRFVLGSLAHGAHVVLVRAIGYRPIVLRAYLVTNDTLEVELRITKAPVQLAPLEVTATAIPPGLDAFEERRLAGFGQFIDWTALRRQEQRRTSDLFRAIAGVRIRLNQFGQGYLTSARGGCPMRLFLDGIPLAAGSTGPPSIDLWSIADLDAIEVYRGPAETPMMFAGTGGSCGTVLLWTRRR